MSQSLVTENVRKRFWQYVIPDIGSECWLWCGSLGSHGYGQMWDGAGPYLSHRLSYMLNKGPIPDRSHVLHTCDNHYCVNPDHLVLGNPKLNAIDREQKGRGNHAKGSRQGLAKLTEDDVHEIRKSTETQRALGERFGVSHTTIGKILRGQNWRHT